MDFIDLGVFWGEKVANLCQPVPTCETGLDGSRGPIEALQSWNLHSDDLAWRPAGMEAASLDGDFAACN